MPDRPAWRWVSELTSVPTAPGREDAAVAWVRRWAARRPDITVEADPAGNLLLFLRDRVLAEPVVAVAHLDHPGFVVEEVSGRTVTAVFRGGVGPERFPGAAVELFTATGDAVPGKVVEHEADGRRSVISLRAAPAGLGPGAMGRWRFPARSLGVGGGVLRAHACDDLAGAAASLAALDVERRRESRPGLVVLLTRAEEVGFVGAIGAVKHGTLPAGARVVSVEASRASTEAPVGSGPIIRVGDASSVFDAALTNSVAAAAPETRRRLMTGGSCEATAFGAYGFPATGVCLPLGNYHNMSDDDPSGLAPEAISLADFDGLVRLVGKIAAGLDDERPPISARLDRLYGEGSAVLE